MIMFMMMSYDDVDDDDDQASPNISYLNNVLLR